MRKGAGMIKKYRYDKDYGCMDENPDGEYMLVADHEADKKALEQENGRLREALIKIAHISSGYASCLHTGGDVLYIAREALKVKK